MSNIRNQVTPLMRGGAVVKGHLKNFDRDVSVGKLIQELIMSGNH